MDMLAGLSFSFPAAGRDEMVEGILHSPVQGRPLSPALIVCHGRNNDMTLPLIRDLCTRAATAGCYALRFNFRYVTKRSAPSSRGREELADLEGALAAVQARLGTSPGRLYLAGKSMGAVVASHLAADRPGLGGYIALGYPLPAPLGPGLADTSHLARLGCPALFVVGDRDPFCRLSSLRQALTQITTSCTLEVIPGGDHSYRPQGMDRDDAYLTQAVDVVLSWLALQVGS